MVARRFGIAWVLALSGLLIASSPSRADEESSESGKRADAKSVDTRPAAKPIAVIASAGIDRLLGGIETILGAAERNDLNQQLNGFLVNLGNFEGFDRQRPAGVMLFLGAGLPPQPEPVGFLPVKDVDRFVKTLAFGPIRTQPIEGREGRFELVGPDGKLQMRIADGWAWIAKKAESVEQPFTDPAVLTRGFLEPYDLAATLDLTAIPAGIKAIGLGTLRVRVESNLQKQKGPEDEQRLQRAVADELLEGLDDLSKDGERLVLGLAVSPVKQQARIEARLVRKNDPPAAVGDPKADATPDADRTSLSPARFVAAVDPAAAARFSLAVRLSERQRTILRYGVQVARRKTVPADATADAALPQLFDSLAATAETGRIDLLTQFVGSPPGPFVLVGGLGMAKSDALAAALPGLLDQARKAPHVAEVKTGVATQSGIALHQLMGEKSSPDVDRLYGEKPALLVGAGKETLWFAVGGRDATDSLGRFIAAGAPDARPENGTASPDRGGVELAVQAGPWVGMQGDRGDPRNVELLRTAFARGNDGLRLWYQNAPAPKLQVELESGWLRLIGLAAGRAVDEKRSP